MINLDIDKIYCIQRLGFESGKIRDKIQDKFRDSILDKIRL